ncbi:MAG TPA: hypothetical protein VNZ56_02295 [Verrucomicrobiae bacterium]|jgi:hypothetical protein|nr:hypothetical protein [Verrucomicrobiae bacterium]
MKNKVVALCCAALFAVVIAAHAQAPAKVAGTWQMTNQGRNGVQTNTLTLTQDGGTLKGTMKGMNGMEIPLDNGTVSGNNIDFTVTRQGRNGEVKVEYKGTVDGDTIKGTFQQGENSVDWTAKRS